RNSQASAIPTGDHPQLAIPAAERHLRWSRDLPVSTRMPRGCHEGSKRLGCDDVYTLELSELGEGLERKRIDALALHVVLADVRVEHFIATLGSAVVIVKEQKRPLAKYAREPRVPHRRRYLKRPNEPAFLREYTKSLKSFIQYKD